MSKISSNDRMTYIGLAKYQKPDRRRMLDSVWIAINDSQGSKKRKHAHRHLPLNGTVHPTLRLYTHGASDIVKGRANRKRKLPCRRVGDEVVEVVGVSARVRNVLELCVERGIEREEVLVCLSKAKCRNFLLYKAPGEGWISDPNTLQLQIKTRMFIDPVGDVWNVCHV